MLERTTRSPGLRPAPEPRCERYVSKPMRKTRSHARNLCLLPCSRGHSPSAPFARLKRIEGRLVQLGNKGQRLQLTLKYQHRDTCKNVPLGEVCCCLLQPCRACSAGCELADGHALGVRAHF